MDAHETDWPLIGLPLESVVVAVSCTVALVSMVALAGVTVTDDVPPATGCHATTSQKSSDCACGAPANPLGSSKRSKPFGPSAWFVAAMNSLPSIHTCTTPSLAPLADSACR